MVDHCMQDKLLWGTVKLKDFPQTIELKAYTAAVYLTESLTGLTLHATNCQTSFSVEFT